MTTLLPLLSIALLFTVNLILPVTSKDWFQSAMESNKWKKNAVTGEGTDETIELAPCVEALNILNSDNPGGWNSFSQEEQAAVLDCMLWKTKLIVPSKLATDMEPMCTMLLKGYNSYTWKFVLAANAEGKFLDCISDRVLNYELEDSWTSSEVKIGNHHAIQWTVKKK